ncbi:MAG TPA: lipopolysaccharide biosynthesis protein [Candidatus Coprenecus stercorigallinarum]|nr:lipopolysaccharide biosynthesis protein [Candidatus Coprenecus stercorigallinarum]
MAESLKKKTVRGTFWSAVDSISSQGVTFLVGLVLARLLTPHEYGLIGYIMILVAVFNSIVDSGFSNALIRKKDAGETDYSTAFIFNLAVSLVMVAAMVLVAVPFSRFFKEPQLVPLVRVMSVIVVINALALIQRTRLVKSVDFKTQTKASLISSVSSGAVGLAMAFGGLGVWSLVGQQISRQLINTVCLWILNRWTPTWRFSWSSFRELFGFGWKLLVSGLIDTVWKEIYQLVIGKFYSTSTLGQYTRGKQFSDIFSSNMTSIVQRVSYPVLSSIQDERERMREGYRKIIRTTMLASFVLLFGLSAVAESLLTVLIGPRWLEAAHYLQIICFAASLYPLHAINLNMLQVQGRSDLFLKLEIVKKIIAVGPLLLGIFIGIDWMLWGSLATSIIAYFLNARYSGTLIGYPIRAQIKDILPSFGVAAAMAACIWPLALLDLRPIWMLLVQLCTGAAVTIGLCEALRLPEYAEIKDTALGFLRRNKK